MHQSIKKIYGSLWCLGVVLGCFIGIGGMGMAKGDLVVVKPQPTDELLANPGMGWQTFNRTSQQDKNLPAWIPSTVHYARWGWGKLEPLPGQINAGFLDGELKKSRDCGQRLAFRVMCCSPYPGKLYHPEWLKQIGGKVMISDHDGVANLPIPDLDDPIVLGRHLDFIRRLGAMYDGHPDLDHVDLGSVGWWGEWHMSRSKTAKMPSLENRMKVVDAYLSAFQKTPLLILLNGGECATYATRHGAGWRCDSFGDLGFFSKTNSFMRNIYPSQIRRAKLQEAWQNGPIAFEPPCDVAEYVQRGWSLRWIFNYGLALHGSYFHGESHKLPADDLCRAELERFLRRLGYRLVLNELAHPASAKPGTDLNLSMKWQNVGSAPCYQPYRVAYRLTNTNGYQKVFASPVTVNRWLPGSIELFTEEFFKQPQDLPPGQIYEVADAINLPADMPPGEYAVSVGIVGVSSDEPVVKLGISGRNQDGWYPLSKLSVDP